MSRRSPHAAIGAAVADPRLPRGTDERFTGFGVFGLPFSSGHYLTLRHFTTSIGPSYTAVWHRDPEGRWQIYTSSTPELSCPRYFSGATSFPAHQTTIEETWEDDNTLAVKVGDAIRWQIRIGSRPSTRLMTGAASILPEAAWSNKLLLAMMGRIAGPVLSVGRIRMAGHTPNRQHFLLGPRQLWSVEGSTATINGEDAGTPGRLHSQTRMADFWLPQLGLVFQGTANFETFDPSRHLAATQLAATQLAA